MSAEDLNQGLGALLEIATTNLPTNATTTPIPGTFIYPVWVMVVLLLLCSLMTAGTILGNILVCMAVSIVRKLRTLSNWLIVSLAVADLCVALLVMPIAAIREVMYGWVLGQAMCDVFTSLDVLLCTSSILNLCMISIDRYFVITKPFQYAIKRKPVHMILMIMAVWTLSAIISIAPLMGWKDEYKEGECELSNNISYQFFATIGAFYLPLTVMIVIYYRIYVVSSRITRAEAKNKSFSERESSHGSFFARRKSSLEGGTGKGSRGSDAAPQYGRSGGVGGNNHRGSETSRQNSDDAASHSKVPLTARKSISFLHRGGSGAGSSRSSSSASKSERKATKTLGVIMGAFTACWLPFFILALIRPFLNNPKDIPRWLESSLLWLGYVNSFLNPIIYARFNRDFRTPFKEILMCKCKGINVRLRSESYTEQFGPASSERRTSVGRPPSGASLLQKPPTENDGLLKPPPSTPDIIVEDETFRAPRPGNSDGHNTSGGKVLYNSTTGAGSASSGNGNAASGATRPDANSSISNCDSSVKDVPNNVNSQDQISERLRTEEASS